MNDEYLWQKSGGDPEIKRLETALAEFRYRETAPPALAVRIERPRFAWWKFPAVVAGAAFATLLVAAGVLLQSSGPSAESELIFIHHPSSEKFDQPPADPAPQVRPATPPTKEPVRRTTREVLSASTRVVRKPVSRSRQRKAAGPLLSKQERYAYDRLLLALSISSSKINIVRNTINGVEEVKAPGSNNR